LAGAAKDNGRGVHGCILGLTVQCVKLNLQKTTQDDVYGYHLNVKSDEKANFFEEAHNDIDKFLKYEQAAKKVFIKAGELLGLNAKSFEPYVLSNDVILHLKDNSPIDLFSIKHEMQFGLENNSLSRKMVIYESYISHAEKSEEDDTCPMPSFMHYNTALRDDSTCSFAIENHINSALNYKEMEGLVINQYIPYLVDHFSLSEDRIFFLERVADLVTRGKDIYGCPASYTTINFEGVKCNNDAFYQELIVRLAEFQVVNLDSDLLSSFEDLANCWLEDTNPLVDQLKSDFLANQKLIDFSYHTE
jgi:hypothetical protein